MAAAKENFAYNLGISRKVFILGKQDLGQNIARQLQSLNILAVTQCDGIWNENQQHVVVAPCNFTDASQVHVLARALTRLNSPDTYKVIYVTAPNFLNFEQFVFSSEIGAHYMVHGVERDSALKEHLKRLTISKDNLPPSEGHQQEYERAKQSADIATLNRLYQKISETARGNVHTLRLLVQISHALGQTKKTVFHLKQILSVNSQDLWAINILLKIFLAINKPQEGLQMLSEVSDFGRYNIVQPQADLVDTLAYLPRTRLTAPMFNYVSSRASLSLRAGRVDEALAHYRLALACCPYGPEEESKILYNMGVGYLKVHKYQDAIEHLERSLKLGETKFAKALRPLRMAQKQLQEKSDLVNPLTKNSTPLEASTFEGLDENLSEIEIT